MQQISGANNKGDNTLLKMAGVIVGTLVVIEILFDPISSLASFIRQERIRRDLPIAKARWESQAITDYTIDVDGFVPIACRYEATLTVTKGTLANVRARKTLFDGTSHWISVDREWWDDLSCSYSDLIIPRIFESVEKNLNSIAEVDLYKELKVTFDPKHGFVTIYEVNSCNNHGLLGGGISDCLIWYKFTNFRPIASNP